MRTCSSVVTCWTLWTDRACSTHCTNGTC
ncbi:hypothetical protein GR160_08065 [Flavobacterium sp. Sd200]|nr:hypothetical protein [Flavobacterium sp. Sd200]